MAKIQTAVNLAPYIKELIRQHKEVVLPGLGGFVTQYRPAGIRKDSRHIEPPSAEVIFDKNLLADNGLLTAHLVRRMSIPEDKALSFVHGYVNSLKKEIREKGSCMMEQLGRLSGDLKGDLDFEALPDLSPGSRSFGLPQIEIPVMEKPVPAPAILPKKPLIPSKPFKRRRLPVAVLVISLLLVGAGVVYLTGLFDRYLKPAPGRSELSKSQTVPEKDKIVFGKPVPEDDTLLQQINRQIDQSTVQEKALHYQEPAKSQKKHPPEPTIRRAENEEESAAANYSGSYHIVSGSFLIPGNADRQKADLEAKGYNPKIIRKNNEFYFVALQSFDSKEDALSELNRLSRELNLPLWVMKN